MLRYRYGVLRYASRKSHKANNSSKAASGTFEDAGILASKVAIIRQTPQDNLNTAGSNTKRGHSSIKTSDLSFKAFQDRLTEVPKNITGDTSKPPRLQHSLARCLYQPMNIVPLRDERTNVFNFTPFLEYVIRVEDFNFDSIAPFISPSDDVRLRNITREMDKKYCSSTSSMTGILSQLHFLISNFRPLNLEQLTKTIHPQHSTFTLGARTATAFILKRAEKGGNKFSISSDKSINRDIILSKLGHCLEALLTTEKSEFNSIFNKNFDNVKPQKSVDHYHYATIGDFVLRSQLDAWDPKLPGTGVFDLKTRAVAAVRHDLFHVENNENYTAYEINKRFGKFESFEREFYELIRSTMLKYSLQARIGDMDGIFVAYHNISKIFGFQYIPQEEMNYILHSNVDTKTREDFKVRDRLLKLLYGEEKLVTQHHHETNQFEISQRIGEAEFNISMQFLSSFLKTVEAGLSKHQHARITMKTVPKCPITKNKEPCLLIFVTPLESSELKAIESMKLQKVILQADNEVVEDYISELEELHEELAQKTTCFAVYAKHEFDNNFKANTSNIPYYNDFSTEMKKYVNKFISNSSSNWIHPYFHYPAEVEDWKVKFNVQQLGIDQRSNAYYQKFLKEQLNLLRVQSTDATKRSDNDFESVRSSMFKLMNGKEEESGPRDSSDISTLQAMLRAISTKNEGRKTASDRNVKKVMWNQK
ncbi:Pet127p [Kluyveromyces lactis]|uniref:KLLA0D14531p n=1 Tax=Kluyveromyces lactis (strain ATCC 8585 / CBS 2359 / DSM 70799 / NBRC 1267 / NRRL Y-1140 / WM37) TaxID=284590 RepID=Q6CQT3_KLULA|nr:uncharacterized protein KLLA0_D14531g [Kluyveromyces lactis]CAH00802.1 KLLA0D14531p [Kluyveromyces lactis]|eukprot:XP_453706.1 uncharacterized protein KLLA0_D14531g [Kluyveromyces lactis]